MSCNVFQMRYLDSFGNNSYNYFDLKKGFNIKNH